MEQNLSYEAAFKELKEIEAEIAGEAVSVDILAQKVKRAAILIQYCQARLRETEEEVNKIIKQMEQNTST
jgi:exodeoxyribonuclease VII small subunit